MKIINDLVICEIPKDASEFEVSTLLNGVFIGYTVNNSRCQQILPSGYEYEVIANHAAMEAMTNTEYLEKVLQIKSCVEDYWGGDSLIGFMQRHKVYTFEATDILFIKRVKK